MSPIRIIIDETDHAAFTGGLPNKYIRLATLLRRVCPDAEHGFVDEAGFSRRDTTLPTPDSDRLWYLSLAPSPKRRNLLQGPTYRIKLAILAGALRLPLSPGLVYKLQWAGAYNLNVALDFLSNAQKSMFYGAFNIGGDIRINMAFKGWLRSRHRASVPPHQPGGSSVCSLGTDDIVVMTGLAKGSEPRVGLLRGKQRSGYKVILILLDCGPLEYPSITSVRDYDLARSNFAVLMRLADIVIVPSEHARRVVGSACEDMRVQQPELSIIRPPIGLSPGGPSVAVPSVERIVARGNRFAVTILAFKPRKDFYWLLAVWRHALGVLGGSLPHLIVVLSDGVGTEFFDPDFIDPLLADHVRIVEQPKDTELTWLYENASFVVHPPSFGGLGTVLTEAAAFGKPCLCERSEAYEDIAETGHVVQLDRNLDAWAMAMKGLVLGRDEPPITSVDSSDSISSFAKQIDDLVVSIGHESVSRG